MKRLLRRWSLWLLLATVLAVAAAALVWQALSERDAIESQELDRLNAQSRIVEGSLTRQFVAIDKVLGVIAGEATAWTRDGQSQSEGNQTLRNMEASMPTVHGFLVIDARGLVELSSQPDLIGRNYFERDYVQVPQKDPRADQLYLSPPFKTSSNKTLVAISRVRLDSDGRLQGVVVASVAPSDVSMLVQSVMYAEDMSVRLIHGDGDIFVQLPVADEGSGGSQVLGDSYVARHVQSARLVSEFRDRQQSGLGHALTVVRTIATGSLKFNRPMLIELSRDSRVLLAPWRKEIFNRALVYLLLTVLSVAALFVYQLRRRERILAGKRFTLAAEASGVGIWEFDLGTKRYYWDPVMFDLFGLDPQRASDRNDEWQQLLSPQDLKRMREATRETLRNERLFDMNFEIKRPDGGVRYLRNRAAVYADEDGNPRRLIGSTEDITERRRIEADLRVAAVAFESSESTMITDAQLKIVRVNQAFSNLFGYTADEVIGKRPRLLASGRSGPDFYEALWQELLTQRSWRGEVVDVRKSGTEFPCWMSISAVCDDDGVVTHYVATHADITLRKASEEEVKRLAFIDPLTNLPNRRVLADRLSQAVNKARRDRGHLALMFVDLDKFKPVNDRYGHAAGDLLLQAVALRLRTCVRESDTVARVGGDEFVVLLPVISQIQDATIVAEKIQIALRRSFELPGDVSVQVSSSIGIALFPEHGRDEAELSHNADVAMYAAKAAGRDQYMMLEPVNAALDPTLYRYE